MNRFAQRLLMCLPMRRYLDLRSRFQAWLFGTPTTAIECLNAALLLAWSLALLDDDLLTLPLYSHLRLVENTWSNEILAVLFALAAVFAAVGALRSDSGSDKLSGFGLQLGAVLWVAVSVNFIASYPPINTGVATYAVLAFFCWCAGGLLWERGSDRRPE